MRHLRLPPLLMLLAGLAAPAAAQDRGTLDPKPLPPLAHPGDPSTPARELFGRARTAAPLPAQSIGGYAKGCVAGAVALPQDGDTWQVMRLSRNRMWGHPRMIAFLQRLSQKLPGTNGWPGLLVGDIAQPRGGPMITGHASHQIGLDADVWLTPMPPYRLSRNDREEMSATNMVRKDRLDIDPNVWTPAHLTLLKTVSQQPEVARVFVNAAIKKALCRDAGADRGWLTKIRPIFGHDYHFHIRLACPSADGSCGDQASPPAGDGCGAELAQWFTPRMLFPKPGPPRKPMAMAALPAECRQVLTAQ